MPIPVHVASVANACIFRDPLFFLKQNTVLFFFLVFKFTFILNNTYSTMNVKILNSNMSISTILLIEN